MDLDFLPKDDIHIVEQLIFTQKPVKTDGVCGRSDIWEEPPRGGVILWGICDVQ